MTTFYTYLISSLPYLHFGARLPFSFKEFLSICARFIPESEVKILNDLPEIDKGFYHSRQPTLKKWQAHQTALRNELVKIRASRRHLEPNKYLRGDGFADLSLIHIALNAQRSTSILEAEKILDEERWRFLEELAFGHYFDLDTLIIYAFKILILERWEKINTADKPKVLAQTLAGV